MTPKELSITLNKIASQIDASTNPSREMVLMDLKRVLASIEGNAGRSHEAVSKSDVLGWGAAIMSALGLGNVMVNQSQKTDAILEDMATARSLGDREFENMVEVLVSKGMMERPTDAEMAQMPDELRSSLEAQPVMADASLMGEQGLKATHNGSTVEIEDLKKDIVFEYNVDTGVLRPK